LNCAENKACHVTSRLKLPTPNNNNLVLIPSGGMSFTDGDGKRVIKIKSSSVARPKQGGIVEYPKEGCARNRVHREELFEESSNG